LGFGEEKYINMAVCGLQKILGEFSVVALILGLSLGNVSALYNDNSEPDTHIASINVTVCKLDRSSCISQIREATYGSSSSHRKVEGYLVHAITNRNGCHKFDFPVNKNPWIALIQRGSCYFTSKIQNAENHNASAVVIYSDKPGPDFKMDHQNNPELVAVSISYDIGNKITSEIDNSSVYVKISFDRTIEGRKINTISVLFVSVSFIVLMVISLAWLVFYYVQRFRFLYARDKTEVRKYRVLNQTKQICFSMKKYGFSAFNTMINDLLYSVQELICCHEYCL
jgi:hypothetical protein